MTQRETFAEFAERVKPRECQKFVDSRGCEWTYRLSAFWCQGLTGGIYNVNLGRHLVHDFIEPKKPKLLARAFYQINGCIAVSAALYSSEDDAKASWGESFVAWPATTNADGFYEVLE